MTAPPRHSIRGRVVALDGDRALVDDGDARREVRGLPPGSVLPGDLVRVDLDPSRPPASVTVVHRPTRPVFTAASETGRVLQGGLGERLALRMRGLDAIRGWFRAEGFLEVETPAVGVCPGLDLHLDAYAVSDRHGALFGHLLTSPEYHMKRLLVGGVPRCFQLARCWRAGELGARHQPEFTMLEWYRAWSGLDAMMADTEDVVRAAASASATPGAITLAGETVSLDGPFERLTVRDAFARHAPEVGDAVELAGRDEQRYYETLSLRVEPMLGRGRPTFLTRFPACHASLAKLAPDDPTVCERAELYVAGVELCNAFHELTDPAEQRRRFEADQRARRERGLPVYPIDEDFLAALEEGLPPSAGNALGVDRLLALVAGRADIGGVMAFPRATR